MEINTAKQERHSPRVLFLNRSYWPDGEATGQLLSELTEDLSSQFDVTVIAGLPNSNPSQERFRIWKSELRKGVQVLRVPHTRFPKGSLFGRIINFVTFLAGASIRGLLCRRQDIVVVETDPFLSAYIGCLLRIRHRALFVVYLQDIHPDLGIAIGRLKASFIMRVLRRSLAACYRSADRVVVLSEDMRATVRKWGIAESKLTCIPNWIDTQMVRPVERGSSRFTPQTSKSSFVVMYSGNLGATQLLDCLIDAAVLVRDLNDIHFNIVGNGTAEGTLRARVTEKQLKNVTFLPFQPKAMLSESLSSADLHLVSAHPAALAYLMPSKFYGILAVGRPVLAAVPDNSELAHIISENRIGIVVPPGNASEMAKAIIYAFNHRDEIREAGQRARILAVTKYDRSMVTRRFSCMLTDVLAETSASATSRSTRSF